MKFSIFSQDETDYSKIQVAAKNVAGPVFMIAGTNDGEAFSGGNIAVSIGEDGVLMIDSKMAPLADKILEQIKKAGGDSPKFVLNTHVHGDHVHGNSAFQKHSHIVAHENVRKRLVETQPQDQWPTITFNDRLSFYFNGEEIRAIHFSKGHTDGDVMVFFEKSGVLHMGDLFFSGLFPYIDLKNGGSVEGYIKNVKQTLETIGDNIKIIPGHGPLSTKKDLQDFYDMLTQTRDLVLKHMKEGKTLEELKKQGLPEQFSKWSWAFISTETWIDTIFNSYSGS